MAVLTIGACRQAEPAVIDANSPSQLTPDAVFVDDSLGWIVEIGLTGDRVVALDAMLQPAVHVVDLEMSRRLGSYGHRGDGPGEFKDPEQVVAGASNSPDEVWILDGIHQRLTRLSLQEIEAGSGVTPETVRMDGPNAGALVRASDGTWFAGGWITGGRVARYHADRRYDRTIVGFPAGLVEAPGMTLLQAYESWVVADPAGGRLATATLLGGLLEIFDHDGGLIAQAAVPDPFQPVWAQGRSRSGRAVMAVGPETRYGFTDLAATQRYLYGVFSGRRVDEDGPVWASPEVTGLHVGRRLREDAAPRPGRGGHCDRCLRHVALRERTGVHPMDRPFPPPGASRMTTTISFADWVDWLAIELTFLELYTLATPPLKHEMAETVRRLAEGIGEAELDAFVSHVPNVERAPRTDSWVEGGS
ncbi:BF3164 family lipoprotein [Candidatus Palauibacter sp.]|uniref:BF3164 family lipoprotein n=1 Tax=Candidatus Palauibacter sp. TaxID=3101350 RepID=UPI003C6F545E